MKRSISLSLVILILCVSMSASGQGILSRTITLDVNRQRLDQVLELLSNKGNFNFSYSSAIVRKDSLVTLRVQNKTVGEVLRILFNDSYEFRESGTYVIIRKAPVRPPPIATTTVIEERIYLVRGRVYDDQSGVAISQASVYEKRLLISTLTNADGYFELKLKGHKPGNTTISVSKALYEDTSVMIMPGKNQDLTITILPVQSMSDNVIITPQDYLLPDSLKVKPIADTIVGAPLPAGMNVERTAMGRFLLSQKQTIQSLNLDSFFTTRPFQLSLIPGVSTHGKMSGQVENVFSLNLFGGYTAGTKGVEIGGLFNIDKQHARYFQAAGLFNIVGGGVTGFQAAGINNTVLNTTNAFQVAGINNFVRGKFNGFQASGIYNHVTDSVKGVQIAGIGNFSKKDVSGVQIGGIFNYAKRLKGLQIGLINIADTSEGVSIGLINIIWKGYHKLTISTNEVFNLNASFKTGNSKLYSMLMAGMNTPSNSKMYAFGYGFGSELMLNKRKTFSLNPEVSSQYVYAGTWDYLNLLNKINVNLTVKLNKYVSLFAGPAFTVFVSDQFGNVPGYGFPTSEINYKTYSFSNRTTGWFGWNAGVNFF